MSGEFIKAILWMFPAFTIMRGSGAFIQGIGNARLSMVLALLDGVILRIGLSWLLGIFFGWGFHRMTNSGKCRTKWVRGKRFSQALI